MTFIRYIFIQVFAYSIDMGGFLALMYMGSLGPIISNALGKIAAGIFAFVAHRRYTFRIDKNEYNSKQMYRYFLLLGLNIPVSSVMLGLVLLVTDIPIVAMFLSDVLIVLPIFDTPVVIAKFISDVIIVLFTFWLSNKWVFVPDIEGENSSFHERI